jgi:hypothetical protein
MIFMSLNQFYELMTIFRVEYNFTNLANKEIQNILVDLMNPSFKS